MSMFYSHIVLAAEITKAVNARLNKPQVVSLSEQTDRELDTLIRHHVLASLHDLKIVDKDLLAATCNAVTCALYIKLEDLLVSLEKESIRLDDKKVHSDRKKPNK